MHTDGDCFITCIIIFVNSRNKRSEELTTIEKEIKLEKGKNSLDATLELIPESNYKESEIVFVLDISLSMDESDPTDIRKQIMANILAFLDSNSKVGLVVFAGKSKIINNGLSNKLVDKKIFEELE